MHICDLESIKSLYFKSFCKAYNIHVCWFLEHVIAHCVKVSLNFPDAHKSIRDSLCSLESSIDYETLWDRDEPDMKNA